jgi:hypothetical protein
MTYEESAALMTDPIFRGRVKVACLKYADSIIIEAVSVAGHASRVRWAAQVFQSPDTVAQQVQPPAVMDAAVAAAGKNVTDEALQGAVEAVVNKTL